MVRIFKKDTDKRSCKGQMTIELVVCIPVLIAIALLVCNAMLFLENCASFDRLARDAIRVYAASPASGQGQADCAALVQGCLEESFNQDYLSVSVRAQSTGLGLTSYTATLNFTPTLFGRAFSGTVFGVGLVPLKHSVSLVLDPYKPGVFV